MKVYWDGQVQSTLQHKYNISKNNIIIVTIFSFS